MQKKTRAQRGAAWLAAFVAAGCMSGSVLGETLRVGDLNLDTLEQGWGRPGANRSVDGHPLKVGGQVYASGLGTHAVSSYLVDLHGTAERFTAMVGVDDEVGGHAEASVQFRVSGDNRQLFDSGVMKAGQPACKVDVDLKGIRELCLEVLDGDNGNSFDHADWGDAQIEYQGAKPMPVADPVEAPVVLTPRPGPEPRINGARIFGARPGRPFLFTIPVTGERPMTFSAQGLPPGLEVDGSTGQITGKAEKAGEYKVALRAKNKVGEARRELRIVIGDQIALTPPMGWNSWNCWGGAVSQEKVLSSARAMAEKGLINHGWTYINIDDGWQGVRGGQFNGIQSNKKFPDMQALAHRVHSLGLKLGIYSTPWRGSYEGHIGGSSDNADGTYDWIKNGQCNENFLYGDRGKNYTFGRYSFATNDALQWMAWGIDYLKYDWGPLDPPHIQEMSDALRKSGRDILYSLSNSAPLENGAVYVKYANAWRTTGDIRDNWQSVSGIGFSQQRWTAFGGPGHWNDPDMLVVGMVGWGPKLHSTGLTPNEQYTHISLWCLLSAPLLIGCDMAQLDDLTLNLLTNDEVLEVNQDPLGHQAACLSKDGAAQIWAKDMEDGTLAVGLFNTGRRTVRVTCKWSALKLTGPRVVRDLWRQKDLGTFKDEISVEVPRHGVALVRLRLP